MSELCGWLGLPEPEALREASLDRMTAAVTTHPASAVASVVAPGAALASVGRGVGTTIHRDGSVLAVVIGGPTWKESKLRNDALVLGDACVFAREVRHRGPAAVEALGDAFAVAFIDAATREVLLATDRIGTIPLFYAVTAHGLVFSSNVRAVLHARDEAPAADMQALYHYFAFTSVPPPHSGFRDVHALGPAEWLQYRRGDVRRVAYWKPKFADDGPAANATPEELAEVLSASVKRSLPAGTFASFLSGGLDSSTTVGLLTRHSGAPVSAYSLGYAEGATSELPYARLAAKKFGALHHESLLTPASLLGAMQDVATAFGVPCGNVSAPAMLTLTRLAETHGVTTMVGGDGGDELFAGNSSYHLMEVLSRWERVPALVRRAVLSPLIHALAPSFPLARRAQGYVRRASMPLPDRLWNWTALFEAGADQVLSAEFLDGVDRDGPGARLRTTYEAVLSTSPLNRHLATDWVFILHSNDLPRVRGACELAGQEIVYPMLMDDVVELSTRIPAAEKMNGDLRAFYKRAFRHLLPDEIISKSKQGEGIPFGDWLLSDPPLREFVADALSTFRRRGIASTRFIDQLLGAPLFSRGQIPTDVIYHMTMLEAWFSHHLDRPPPGATRVPGRG